MDPAWTGDFPPQREADWVKFTRLLNVVKEKLSDILDFSCFCLFTGHRIKSASFTSWHQCCQRGGWGLSVDCQAGQSSSRCTTVHPLHPLKRFYEALHRRLPWLMCFMAQYSPSYNIQCINNLTWRAFPYIEGLIPQWRSIALHIKAFQGK